MNGRVLAMALLASVVAASVHAGASFYKWKDADGQWHFSDTKPAEVDTQQRVINTRSTTATTDSEANGEEDDAGRERASSRPQRVVMYSAEWCGVCKKARAFMVRKKIPFREYDIEKTAKGKRDYRQLNGNGVPLILVGENRMSGFSGGKLLRWLGRE